MQNQMHSESKPTRSVVLTILACGAMWGIFEATAGYLLHLLPIKLGWLVWYPVACFFMGITYQRTKKASSILYVAFLSAGIKLLNLFLPVRIDMVLNPSMSIILEGLTMFLAVHAMGRLKEGMRKKPYIKALAALGMNIGWRLLYILYILFLVPQWIRDVSVISSAQQLLRFLLTDNLVTSAVIALPFIFADRILFLARRLKNAGKRALPAKALRCLGDQRVKMGGVALLICIHICLQMLL